MVDMNEKYYECTDLGNVERFVDQHKARIKAYRQQISLADLGWNAVAANWRP